jgi:hypothetical protein
MDNTSFFKDTRLRNTRCAAWDSFFRDTRLRNTRRAAWDRTRARGTNFAVRIENSEPTESERTNLRGDGNRQ